MLPSEVVLPSGGIPPSGSELQGPQTPAVAPCAATQVCPTQQSALIVHFPQLGTQPPPTLQMNFDPASAGLGTHGRPLQQSALVEHACPALTQAASLQRGTPTLSSLQVSWWQLPEQQSHDALHDIDASLQTSPSGLQPVGFRHTPRGPLPEMLHVTLPEPVPGIPAEPQQSES